MLFKPNKVEYKWPARFIYKIVGQDTSGKPSKRSMLNYKRPGTEEKVSSVESLDTADDESLGSRKKGALWRCSNPKCNAVFIRYGNFTNHELSNNCHERIRPEGTADYILKRYSAKYSNSKFDVAVDRRQKRYMATHLQR